MNQELFGLIPGEADGAIPNGSRIVKATFEPGDANPIGTRGTVLASHGPLDGEFGYFVEWETFPGVPIFCRGSKIGRAVNVCTCALMADGRWTVCEACDTGVCEGCNKAAPTGMFIGEYPLCARCMPPPLPADAAGKP